MYKPLQIVSSVPKVKLELVTKEGKEGRPNERLAQTGLDLSLPAFQVERTTTSPVDMPLTAHLSKQKKHSIGIYSNQL